MKIRRFSSRCYAPGAAVALILVAGFLVGCKANQPVAPTDLQLASSIQAKIQGESALSKQNIQVGVNNGVATLSGAVTDDASRALAGNDSGTIAGVKTVVNNLTIEPMQAHSAAPAPPPAPTPMPAAVPSKPKPQPKQQNHTQAQASSSAPMPSPQQMPQASAQNYVPAPPPPPDPPKPVVRQVTLPAGTSLPIRITEELSSKSAQANDVFHGTVASDVRVDGLTVIPSGASVVGRVVDAKDATHFSGSSLLSLELTQITAHGQKISLITEAYSQQGAARGKNTAIKAGGGAVLGTVIGAIAGGGKGAVIGGLAGAGAGTGVNAATRGQQVEVASESIITFNLQSPVTLNVTTSPSADDTPGDPSLQVR